MKTLEYFKAAYNDPTTIERFKVTALLKDAEKSLSPEDYNLFINGLERKRYSVISLKNEPTRVFEADFLSNIFLHLSNNREDVNDLIIYDLGEEIEVDVEVFLNAWDNGETITDLNCLL